MSSELIQALCNPASYDHPVEKVQLISTHISWLLLTGEYVYKIKKPVNLGFLDFSTIEKRKFFCQEEIRLNSRFVPERYLGVIPITGNYASPILDGEGQVIEYAVKMRQFDQGCLMENLADSDALSDRHAQMIGFMIADMHSEIKRANSEDDYGTVDNVWRPVEQNFSQIAPLIQDEKMLQQLQRVEKWSKSSFEMLRDKLCARRENGFVRECHGDLHLGNMILSGDGDGDGDGDGERVEPFDCLEFSPQLSWVDTCNELAFVVMDLECRGLNTQAVACLNAYMEKTGDYEGLVVLPFYKIYRAMVRAKVALLKVQQLNESDDTTVLRRQACYSEFERYLSLAEKYTRPLQSRVCLMHGISGSGKSTVARRLAAGMDAVVLRSDIERKRMFNLGSAESSHKVLKRSIYTKEVTQQLFLSLQKWTKMLLAANFSVIVDATFLDKKWRDSFYEICQNHQVPFFIVSCVANPATIENWLALRASDKSEPSEADFSIAKQQMKDYAGLSEQELPYCIEVRTDTEWKLEDVLSLMSEKEGQKSGV